MEEKVVMNRMGTEPVNKLLLKMGIPMIISMMVQALYNIVDSIFVGRMPDFNGIVNAGEYALNALTLAFPVHMLMVAVGVGTGVGVNAILSKSLGEGNRKKASMIAGNAIFIGIIMYIVFLLFGLFGVDWYLQTQTSDPIVLEMGDQYLTICTTFSFGIIMYTLFEKLLQGTGKTIHVTISQILGAVTNIILDPIMIYGIGMPAMGVRGAAIATVIGQMVSMVLNIIFHYTINKDVDRSLRYIRPNGTIIKEIFKIGVPAIIMQAVMSFMTYGVNVIFGTVSAGVVTAYGVYYKIQQFIFFAAFGMNNAIIPVVSFNYGMRDRERVRQGIRYGMIYTLIIMGIGIVILEAFANPLAATFGLTAETSRYCVLAMRIVAIGYLFAGANIAYQGIFQALGNGMYSLIVSLLRCLIVTLPLAYVLTLLPMAENVIWMAFPVAELVAMFVGIVLMKRLNKKKILILQ